MSFKKYICNYNKPIQSLTCKYQIIKKILWKLGNRQRDHCLFSQGHTMTLQAARSTHLPLTSHLPFISIFDSFDAQFSSAQLNSVAQSCLTLCNPMDGSTPGLPVHHQLPEFTQTHVHWVDDATHPSHPLSSPSLPALNLSQHQGLFKWVSSLHQEAKVLEFQLQLSPSKWTPGTDLL